MDTNPRKPTNPLKQPRAVSKWYAIEDFRIRVEKCRACGQPVTITREDLERDRYVVCPCGKGCFEVELRVVHTIDEE